MKRKYVVSLGAAVALAAASLAPAVAATAAPPAAVGSVKVSALEKCPLMIAHRGGIPEPDKLTPENSMAGFERAARIGVWAIETDIWYTKDGQAVIMHDETLDRSTNGSGKVSDYTLAEIEELKLYADPKGDRVLTDYRVPTFEEVLDLAVEFDMTVIAEYKDEDDEGLFDKFYTQIKNSGAKAMVSGFSKPLMVRTHKIAPQQELMWFNTAAVEPNAVPEGAFGGFLNITVTKEAVDKLTAAGIKTNVWYNTLSGGDDPDGAGPILPGNGWNKMSTAGATWISTDYPIAYRKWEFDNASCESRGKSVQKPAYDCVAPPKSLPTKKRKVVLPSACQTQPMAGTDKSVKVKVKGNKSKLYKRVNGDEGKVSLRATGKKGKITVTYHYKSSNFWQNYERVKTYKIK